MDIFRAKLPIGTVEASALEVTCTLAHIKAAHEADADWPESAKVDPKRADLTAKFLPSTGGHKTVSKINLLQKCQKSWFGSVDCFGGVGL